MREEYVTRTFKSGNSVALRLPKALGLREGDEVTLVPHADGSFSFWPSSAAKQIFLSLYGAFSEGFMAEGRGETDQEDRNWGSSPRDRAA